MYLSPIILWNSHCSKTKLFVQKLFCAQTTSSVTSIGLKLVIFILVECLDKKQSFGIVWILWSSIWMKKKREIPRVSRLKSVGCISKFICDWMGKLLGRLSAALAAQWTPGAHSLAAAAAAAVLIAVPTKSVLTISFDRSLLRVIVLVAIGITVGKLQILQQRPKNMLLLPLMPLRKIFRVIKSLLWCEKWCTQGHLKHSGFPRFTATTDLRLAPSIVVRLC